MSSARPSPRSSRPILAAAAVFALVVTGMVFTAESASAATLTVTTTDDTDTNNACADGSTVTTVAVPTSLRNALCVAANIGGASTITVPQGVYELTDGALVYAPTSASSLMLSSSGGTAEIVGDGSSQILALDPEMRGGVDVELAGFAFTGGRDSVYGGGAIIAGSLDADDADSLVVRNSTFTDNASTGGATNPGGAIQFIGGDLTITSSTFDQNAAGAANGGAVYYESSTAGDALLITDSEFTGNTVAAASIPVGGGAIYVDTNGVGTAQVTDSTFTDNTATGANGIAARGGAIQQVQGPATISRNVFSGNTAAGAGAGGGAVDASGGALTAHGNSFIGNAGSAALSADGTSATDATRNWWGCNAGPGEPGCDTAAIDSGDTAPFLVLTASASAATVTQSVSTALTASLRTDSAGDAVPGAQLTAFDGQTVAWTGIAPAGSTVAPADSEFTNGVATTTFTAGTTVGAGGATATFGTASALVEVVVSGPPAFTSPSTASAVVGTSFSFVVSTDGYPLPAIALTAGALADGLDLTIGSDGTATISGTPVAGTAGQYVLGLTATAGTAQVQQTLTLTVEAAPAAPTPTSATVRAGEELDVTISAAGAPLPVISSPDLPDGLALDAPLAGTARLHGVPTVAPGIHEFTLAAANTHGRVESTFTLTITAQPAFASADSTTFTVGTAGSFPIEVTQGYPTTGAVTLTDGAPDWLSVTGDPGAQSLVGTPPAGSGGIVALELSVDGIDGPVAQDFTLTINEAPVITTQPEGVKVLGGTSVGFTATATGWPAPTVQWQRSTDGTWEDMPGMTGTDLGMMLHVADDGTRLRAVFTNTAGTATSDEVLLNVGRVPSIDAVADAEVLAGAGVSIEVVSSGSPDSALSAAGLPSWLTFTDAGDGTAALTGTPAVSDAGTATVTVTADNGYGTDDETFEITVAATVPLPDALPDASDGELSGVPATVEHEQRITVSGDGFLPGTTVQVGIYSVPELLSTATADDSGAFSTEVTIPADLAIGAHTLAASGIGADGTAQLLTAPTALLADDDSDADTDGTADSGAGADGTSDAGADGTTDAGSDTGADAGTDAGADTGTDGTSDTGADGTSDTGSDGSSDAGSDAGTAVDGASDAGSDTGADTDGASDAGSSSADGSTADASASTSADGTDGTSGTDPASGSSDGELSTTGMDSTLSIVLGGAAVLVVLAGLALVILARRKSAKKDD